MGQDRHSRGGEERSEETGEAPNVGSFDRLWGTIASGWVWDRNAPDERATVEFVVDGQVIHAVEATLFRPDVQSAGFGGGWAGFQAILPLEQSRGASATVHARLRGTSCALENSPRTTALPNEIERWLTRRERVRGAFLTRLRRRLDRSVGDTLLSVILPTQDARTDWLAEAIDSVLTQWCSRWELVVVQDSATAPEISKLLKEYSAKASYVRAIRIDGDGGEADQINAGLAAATGDYFAILHPQDVIEPDAVYHLLRATRTGAELIYSDELLTGERSAAVLEPQVRPAFCWDYYICHPYFTNIVCVKSQVARATGWNGAMGSAAEFDYILRAIERSRQIAHVPAVLYRRRSRQGDVASKPTDVASIRALNAHLGRVSPGSIARPTDLPQQYRVDFPDDHGVVLIVIPTKNRIDLLRPCVESILASTSPEEVRICIIDHESDDPETCRYIDSLVPRCEIFRYRGEFNYARMNNLAVAQHRERHGRLPPYVLFANNDLEVMHTGWLERMRSLAGRADVGAVGATLLYATDTVQHSGVILGINGGADHAHKFAPFLTSDGARTRGYLSTLVSTREYSAVTAACIMMRSEVFEAIDGFDERFVVGFNDTDLCLRIGERGLKILNDGATVLHHYESATRSVSKKLSHPEDDQLMQSRWGHLIRGNDPFYNRLFSEHSPDHRVVRYTAFPVVPRVRPGLAAASIPRASRSWRVRLAAFLGRGAAGRKRA